MMAELRAWEENQAIPDQLVRQSPSCSRVTLTWTKMNAFQGHFKGTDIGFIPPAPTVTATALSTKVPIRHVMKVIDRTLGDTELEKETCRSQRKDVCMEAVLCIRKFRKRKSASLRALGD
jgi:hypothetical protein